MWSILTMPVILRKSLPNYDPSLSIIGSYAVVGAIAVGLGVRTTRPTVSYDSAVLDGVCGVSALRASSHPVYHIRCYVSYTVQILWCVWFDRRGR